MRPDPLVERLRRRLADDPRPATPALLAEAVRAEGALAGRDDSLAVIQRLEDELLGAGPLAGLLRETCVTDVLVNSPDEVWVDRGRGLERAAVRFPDDEAVRALVHRLLAPTGRRLDPAQPWVDARLGDGTRLHAILPPLAGRATCVSLRTLRRQHLSLDALVGLGTLPVDLVPWLQAIVDARLAIVVSGGTGTGKTTLLSGLLGLVDPTQRVLVVEDAAELRPRCPHVVCLEARQPNVEGAGAVTVRELVRQALRMRPDRLVVGEVRGPEVVDMLSALNTGHEGGLTTVHANSAADVPVRLEALSAGALDRGALHAAMAAALDVVVHLTRGRDGVRRVATLSCLERRPGGEAHVVEAIAARNGRVVAGSALPALRDLLDSRGCPVPPQPGEAGT
jgi:pilus assembly protein CpaF